MSILITIGGKDVLHPDEALEAAQRIGTPFDFWQRANSYTCPLGPEAGTAWLLLKRSDLDALDKLAFHQLKWVDGDRTLEIPKLLMVRALTMNLALAGDANAARLVEFRDRRHIFRMSSINKQYNIRRPAPNVTSGSRLYYEESLNGEQIDGGTIWTWQEIVTDIWKKLPGDAGANPPAGTAPTLPYTPNGTPEGFRFIGVDAWDSLHCVLKAIGCTTAYDPVADTFSYVRLGTVQAGLAGTLTGLSDRLMYDYDPADDLRLADTPEIVRVFFHRQELYHGIEKDTTEADNWEMSPTVSKDYASGVAGVRSGSVVVMHDPLPALFDSNGDNTNAAALQTRADEVGANVVNRIAVSDERMRRMYAGVVANILPGSEVSEVRWRDHGDDTGLVTEVLRKPLELSPSDSSEGVCEELQTPDLARHTHPLWPRLGQPVQVDDGSSTTGDDLIANASGLFPGVVRRWASGSWESLDTCWIRPTDLEAGVSPNPDTVVRLRQKDTLLGRLSGSETVSGDTRPIYLVRLGAVSTGVGEHKLAKIKTGEAVIAARSGETPGTGLITVWEFNNGALAATAEELTAYNWADYPVPTSELFELHQESDSGRWLVQTDGENTIEGFSPGSDGQETWYPYERLRIFGDRDQTSALGNVIDVQVNPLADGVEVVISGTGDLFRFADEVSPQGFEAVALGETIALVSEIDETFAGFTEWRATASTITLAFGKLLLITGDTGSEIIYPLETFDIVGTGGASVAVAKAADTVTATITAGNDGRVKVRTSDNLDFLEDQLLDWIGDVDAARFVVNTDMLVLFQTDPIVATTEELRAFIDSSAITGYAASGEIHLALDDDVLKWIPPAVQDGKTKVRTTDNLDFLEVQFVNWITDGDGDRYKSAEDPVIEVQTEGAATAEQLRLFINSSDITGYSATGEVHLALDENVLKWIVPGASDGRTKVRTTDVLGFQETQYFNWIADADGDRFKSAEDLLVEVQTVGAAGSEQLQLFVNSSDISGYSASGELHLALDANVLKWIVPSAAITWTAKGDKGVNQTISGGDTAFFEGSNLTAAGAQADRGIVSTGVAGDIIRLSIDETVLSEMLLSGDATNAVTVNVEDGVRNQIEFVSSQASVTTEANGADGYIELVGSATLGTIEVKLHQLDSGKTRVESSDDLDYLENQFVNWTDTANFNATFDPVVNVETIVAGDSDLKLFIDSSAISGYSGSVEQHLTIDGVAGLKWKAPSAGTTWIIAGDTGSETISSGDTMSALGGNGIGTAAAVVDTLTISIDATVLQQFTLSGSGTSGTTPVLVGGGTAADNTVVLISSGSSSTTRETGVNGWVQIIGTVNGSVELQLHEGRRMTFNVEADTGPSQDIVDLDDLRVVGSSLAAAGAAADRGVTTVMSAPEVLTVSVDQTVHQKTTMIGDGTNLSTVLISGGTRNVLTLRSDGASSTVQEVGATGWIEIVDTGTPGEVAFILHEQSAAAGGTFTVDLDIGPSQVIAAGDTLVLQGSTNLTPSPTAAKRGIVTTGVNFDEVEFSIDESVHTETALTGETTGGTNPVLVSAHPTRNTLGLHTDKTSTVTEISAAKGWIQTLGDAAGVVELILHERRLYEFTVAADSGMAQTILDTDQLQMIGSNLQFSPGAQGTRGIVTKMVATDICQFSIDETVHTKTVLVGAGTDLSTILIGSTGRNEMTLVSGGFATTVDSTVGTPAGSKGWIELKSTVTAGEIEVVLHEQTSIFSFSVDADVGTAEVIVDGDTLLIQGSGGVTAVTQSERGVTTSIDPTDRITISIDQTPLTEVVLAGTAQTGESTINIEDGNRNQLIIRSNKAATVEETTESKGYIEIDGGTDGGFDLILHEMPQSPIGRVEMSVNTTARAGWALMDGTANAAGSGIDMTDYFVRGVNPPDSTGTGGRTGSALTDSDEVRVQVAVDDHVEHYHQVDADACDDDTGATFFKFSTANKRTGGVVNAASSPLTLIHNETVTVTNGQAGTSPTDEHIEMLPAHQFLFFFERIT